MPAVYIFKTVSAPVQILELLLARRAAVSVPYFDNFLPLWGAVCFSGIYLGEIQNVRKINSTNAKLSIGLVWSGQVHGAGAG